MWCLQLQKTHSLCVKLREKIVSQFKDNVSQRKIANNLGLSPSTVYNIVKPFRESGEILVREGQGWKPLLNAHNHWAPWGGIVWETIMLPWWRWAQEYFIKSLSLNTIHRCNKKCNLKLYYANMKALILRRIAAEFDGPEVIWDQWRAVHFTPGPSVWSYTVPPELIHLLVPSLWYHGSRHYTFRQKCIARLTQYNWALHHLNLVEYNRVIWIFPKHLKSIHLHY